MRINIYRYNPEIADRPYSQDYDFDETETGPMLLDALLYIKANLDATLTLRRSCREGVCGSDGMNINGSNGLACITPLAKLTQPVNVRPLPGLPVIRDLVVDMTPLNRQYRSVRPWLANDRPAAQERLQTPAQRAELDNADECIQCGCCSSACPSFWWNPDKFVGPAGLLTAYRFIADTRDEAEAARLADFQDAYRLYRCHGIMNCAAVCPKGLNPAAAISKMKIRMLKL
ncbi:MAG TPA: succinate dehydrogenase iron-sulfur subunit [Burkholderiales bacterium]|nr:succinate dehydrogenase iron-sulfur subunit [Burkholderiales bacterium]